jgi:NADH-quinone oxidoreductase E subunit
MIQLKSAAGPAASPFDTEQQKRFDEGLAKAVAKYPADRTRAALLPALHLAQDLLGWLPAAAMAYVGFRLDAPPARVREVATFYSMYRLKPVGRHHIEVCNSVSCWAMGSEKILKRCEEKLGIRPGEVSRDGKYSLGEAACLAACGYAPALIVNNYRYVEHVDEKALDALFADLDGAPGQAMAAFPVPDDAGRSH